MQQGEPEALHERRDNSNTFTGATHDFLLLQTFLKIGEEVFVETYVRPGNLEYHKIKIRFLEQVINLAELYK